jgi:DNA-binding GntR family transcriptional regulator
MTMSASNPAPVSPPRPAQRQQLPDEVAAYVREQIISGKVRPGDFLRMEPIAEAVGVSNTPVREGLLKLQSEGFVRLVPRRGFVVASFTRQDVRDLFWAQAQLASELAARATTLITDADLDRLEHLNAGFPDAARDGDRPRLTGIGESFHVIINRAANSHRLALLLKSVASQLPTEFYASIDGQITATHHAHPAILEAMRKRQTRKVRKLMEEHILDMAEHLIATLEERGMWADAEEPPPGSRARAARQS